MADSLDSIRKQVRDRMKELAPLVDEYRQLEEAMSALDGGSSSAAPAPRAARSGGAAKGGGGAKRGRRKGSGTRAAEALRLVGERPGITIGELAEAMGIQQNYLYRVMPSLADEGKVVKSGRGWHLREPQGDAA
jgi:DNA-binding transcriptional ArsR family regulator